MKQVDGWWTPDDDLHGLPAILKDSRDRLPKVLSYVPADRRRFAIQAGGFVGVYPAALSEMFGAVLTFEADTANFSCLARNHTWPGVVAKHAALWDQAGRLGTASGGKNAGMARVTEAGMDVMAVTIDAMCDQPCDFIYLDIEGAEYRALIGAHQTIRRDRPVVAFEDNGHGAAFGEAPGAAQKFLESLNYRRIDKVGKDVVMGPRA